MLPLNKEKQKPWQDNQSGHYILQAPKKIKFKELYVSHKEDSGINIKTTNHMSWWYVPTNLMWLLVCTDLKNIMNQLNEKWCYWIMLSFHVWLTGVCINEAKMCLESRPRQVTKWGVLLSVRMQLIGCFFLYIAMQHMGSRNNNIHPNHWAVLRSFLAICHLHHG